MDACDVDDFKALLAELDERFRVEVHAYCLMGNHYHVLLRTPDANLSRVMRHLDGAYTQRFHRRRGTDGPLFRGRYHAVLVQADRHLLQVSRYIHLNPVEAGLVTRAEDWPHSSFRGYLDPVRAPRWLRTSAVLGHFGSIGTRQQYRRFVAMGLDPGTRDFYGRTRLSPVLGGDDFRERVRLEATAVDPEIAREIPELRELARTPLATIGKELAEEFGMRPDALRVRPGRATRIEALARGAFVHAARRLGGWRLREIAAWLGYRSYASAAKAAVRFQVLAREDPGLVTRLASVSARLGAESARNGATVRASDTDRGARTP